MVDSKNTRHERFWRQMARWLVASALDNVNIDIVDNVVEPGRNVAIRVRVFDDAYRPIDFVNVTGILTNPSGLTEEIRFHPELSEEGEYVAEYVPGSQGVFDIEVVAHQSGRTVGSSRQSILARPSKKEFFDATLKREFLENLAEESGGVYYTPLEAADIPIHLSTRKTETSVTRIEYLWDMPLIFILAILLLSAEWYYRRRKGLS